MTKLFSIFLISAFVFLFSTGIAFASVSCQPVYGGGQTCVTTGNIQVTKTVQNPHTFAPGELVTFNISVTNTGGAIIQQVAIRDLFPPNSSIFVSGPGIFDANAKTLTFTTDNLAPNETRNFAIVAKVTDANQLQSGRFCLLNQVTATANTGQMSQNNAQVCVEKPQGTTKGGFPVFPPPKVVATPSTGPELIPLVGLLPAGLFGWFLRKKSQVFAGKK